MRTNEDQRALSRIQSCWDAGRTLIAAMVLALLLLGALLLTAGPPPAQAMPSPPVVTMSINNSAVLVGETLSISVLIDNTANTDPASNITFETSQIQNASFLSQSASCGGSSSNRIWTNGVFSTMSEFLQAGNTCAVGFSFTVDQPGTQTVSVSNLSSSLGASNSASVSFTVYESTPPGVSVEFDPPVVSQGQPTQLVVTIDNRANAIERPFSLDTTALTGARAEEVVSECTTASWSGGMVRVLNQTLPAGVFCKISVELTFDDVTNQGVVAHLTSDLGDAASSLTGIAVTQALPPTISVGFADSEVYVAEMTTFVVTVDNTQSFISAQGLDMTAFVGDSATISSSATCGGGGSATSGGTYTVSNRTAAPQATCTFDIGVRYSTAGTKTAKITSFSTALGATDISQAFDDINVVERIAPTITATFDPAVIQPGQETTLTIKVDNAASDIAASEFLASAGQDLALATVQLNESTCTGVDQFLNGTNRFIVSNGSVGAGEICEFSLVAVFPSGIELGAQSVSINFRSSSGVTDLFFADLELNVAPAITTILSDTEVAVGSPTTLEIHIPNGVQVPVGLTFDLTGLADATVIDINTFGGCTFSDYTFAQGVFTPIGLDVPSWCQIHLDVSFATAGTKTVSVDNAMSSLGASMGSSDSMQVLALVPPVISITFEPATVPTGMITEMVVTIDNSASIEGGNGLTFSTSEFDGATATSNTTTCVQDGLVGLIDDAFFVESARFTAEAACEFRLGVRFDDPGAQTIEIANATSTLGDSAAATGQVFVVPRDVPIASLSFSPAPVFSGDTVTVAVQFDNSASDEDVTNLAFRTTNITNTVFESFGPNSCQGNDPNWIAEKFSMSGISLDAGATCSVSILVRTQSPAELPITVGNINSSVGPSLDASAVLTIASVGTLVCQGQPVTINMVTHGSGVGTEGDDVIQGTEGSDIILGLGGNDIICGLGGDDNINGGTGDDVIDAGDGDDTVQGFDGDDVINGQGGNDKLFGAKGADTITGGDGDDTIHGNRGNDKLFGNNGADRIFGYAHDDEIFGGPGDDRLHGNFGDDIVNGDAGDDRIFGYGDNDTLDGGADDDLIGGNFGNDVITGGPGNDTLYGSDGTDEVDGGAGDDTVEGNSGNDLVRGGTGDDALDGGINVDTCVGGLGTDTATRCETEIEIP